MLVAGRPLYSTVLSVLDANILVNVLASVITLLLMVYMRARGTLRFSLYVKCVVFMTLYQMIYDTSLVPVIQFCPPRSGEHICTSVVTAGFVFGGLGAATFSWILLALATFTIDSGRELTAKEQNIVVIGVHFFLIIYTIPYILVAYRSDVDIVLFDKYVVVYNYMRFLMIGISFLIIARFIYLFFKLTEKGFRVSTPLYHLLMKLIWYPLVQCVTRLGISSYDLTYDSDISNFPENANATQTALAYMYVLLGPAAGVGTMLIFLYVQADAASELKNMLCCNCHFQNREISNETTQTKPSFFSHRGYGGGDHSRDPSTSAGTAKYSHSTYSRYTQSSGSSVNGDSRNPSVSSYTNSLSGAAHAPSVAGGGLSTLRDDTGSFGSQTYERLSRLSEKDLLLEVTKRTSKTSQLQDTIPRDQHLIDVHESGQVLSPVVLLLHGPPSESSRRPSATSVRSSTRSNPSFSNGLGSTNIGVTAIGQQKDEQL